MKRSVLFDTETTGFDPEKGDRIIEIAALELIDDIPTGEVFHVLIDPERDVPEEATRVHGFTAADLAGKPKFAAVAEGFLSFVRDSSLIAHNARFDFKFINAELKKADYPPVDMSRMIDTLDMARERFPGMPNSLDALCRRFGVDLSARTTHNALLDCKLLADVYVELMGGRQRGLGLAEEDEQQLVGATYNNSARRHVVRVVPSKSELAEHDTFVKRLDNPLWSR